MATIELTPDHGYVMLVAGAVAVQARRATRRACASLALRRAACAHAPRAAAAVAVAARRRR
jgi:hypothetical protein